MALSLVTRDDTLSTAVRLASADLFFHSRSLLGAAVLKSDAWSHDSAVNFEIGAQIQRCNHSCVSILDVGDSGTHSAVCDKLGCRVKDVAAE